MALPGNHTMLLMGSYYDTEAEVTTQLPIAVDENGVVQFNAADHTHEIADIEDLQDELDALETETATKQDQDILLDAIAAVLPTITKGTLLVFNGTTVTTLPPGTNGQVLKANSGTATGLEWAADAT